MTKAIIRNNVFFKLDYRWGTAYEIRFLNGLGTFGIRRAVTYTPEERYELQLSAYRKRVKWDDIDKKKVLKHLKDLLGKC